MKQEQAEIRSRDWIYWQSLRSAHILEVFELFTTAAALYTVCFQERGAGLDLQGDAGALRRSG